MREDWKIEDARWMTDFAQKAKKPTSKSWLWLFCLILYQSITSYSTGIVPLSRSPISSNAAFVRSIALEE